MYSIQTAANKNTSVAKSTKVRFEIFEVSLFNVKLAAVTHPSMLELLLEAGSPVDANDDGGATPLIRACSLEGGLVAIKDSTTKFGCGTTPFKPAPTVPETFASVRLLLGAGADIHAVSHGLLPRSASLLEQACR